MIEAYLHDYTLSFCFFSENESPSDDEIIRELKWFLRKRGVMPGIWGAGDRAKANQELLENIERSRTSGA